MRIHLYIFVMKLKEESKKFVKTEKEIENIGDLLDKAESDTACCFRLENRGMGCGMIYINTCIGFDYNGETPEPLD